LEIRFKGEFRWVVMLHSLLLLATKIVEVLFFVGLVGCVLVVTISWISIFKEGFSNSDDHASSIR
jgi:hypothetical protein